MNRISVLMLLTLSLSACKKTETSTNKFSDDILVKIGDLQDKRASDSLYTFFSSENPVYRQAAVLAFASIQDSAAVQKIANLLFSDTDTTVRKASAFALGQTRSIKSASLLSEALTKETQRGVVKDLLEAYGKVTQKWQLDPEKITNKEGLAWSLYRSGLTKAVDESHNELAAALLNKKENEDTRLGAAHFFLRGAVNFESVLPDVIRSALTDPSAEVRMASTGALRKIQNDSVFNAIDKIVRSDQDYRVRVNAIRALQNFQFEKSKDLLFESLTDKNVNVGIAASETILTSVTENFWVDLANRVTDLRHWRIQANLYEAILKVTANQTILNEIKLVYQRSANPYQKAALLTALQQSAESVDFIKDELLKADTPVVRSAAASALVAFNKSKKFQPQVKGYFSEIYKKAIQTNDAAVIGIIAGALGDSTLGYRKVLQDFTFLTEARNKLALPKDNEALQPLEAAIAYFEGRKAPRELKNEFNHPIDWNLVKSIPKHQQAVIKTTRGNIIIRLLVEEAPGSVANFVSLARQDYFDNKIFHRVVPNFVVQAGCNRGDGWGSEDYSIRSEFSQIRYRAGSVGMASAGKDTEGTQWFITHSATPHLDGRYTIFAEVEKGMDIVHRLEIADRITDVEIRIEGDLKDEQD